MKRLTFAPLARADLQAITRFIAEDNPMRAETFLAELEGKARQAAERPRSCPARGDLSPGLRSLAHGRYVLFFRELPDEVRIVRVLHGARNLAKLL